MKKVNVLAGVAAWSIILTSCDAGAATPSQDVENEPSVEATSAIDDETNTSSSEQIASVPPEAESGDSTPSDDLTPEPDDGVTARCGYDPDSGKGNPFGLRAFVSVIEKDGSTTFVYEHFSRPAESHVRASISTKSYIALPDVGIEEARSIMRENGDLFNELIGYEFAEGYSTVDESLTCTTA